METGHDYDYLAVCSKLEKNIQMRMEQRLRLFARLGRFGTDTHGKMIEGLWEIRAHPHGARAFMSTHGAKGVFVVNSALVKKKNKLHPKDIERAKMLAEMARDLPLPD